MLRAMSGQSLLTAFLAALPARMAVRPNAELEAQLETILADARHVYPSLRCSPADYAAHLASVLVQAKSTGAEDTSDDDPAAQLTRLATRDLYLACAAARGDDDAVRILDEQCIAPLRATLRRGDTSEDVVGDALQTLRMLLLVGTEDAPPRLLAYAGRGDLKSWVRVAATRVLINSKRGARHESLDDDLRLSEHSEVEDVEVSRLKQAYKLEFHECFREALATLSARARNLLRQHYIDGLTMEQVGALYRVHRITVHRWIDSAREDLALATRERMAKRLRLEGPEVESILRLIHSQMGNSLRAFMDHAQEEA